MWEQGRRLQVGFKFRLALDVNEKLQRAARFVFVKLLLRLDKDSVIDGRLDFFSNTLDGCHNISPVRFVVCGCVRSPERFKSFRHRIAHAGSRNELSAQRIHRRRPLVAGKRIALGELLGLAKPGYVGRHRAAGVVRRRVRLPHIARHLRLGIITEAPWIPR